MNERPGRRPASRKPGGRSRGYEPCGETCVNQSNPAVRQARPMPITRGTPIRVTMACDAPAETMIEMARVGLGICIVPALTFAKGGLGTEGLRLYHTGLEPRRIVALFPPQYQAVEPYGAMIAALGGAGAALTLPKIQPALPFVASILVDWRPES